MPRQPQQPKRKKTIHGGGTIYLRKDGRYVASITDPNTDKRIERYAKTEKEAEKKLEDIKYEIRQNTLATGPNQTVQQYITHWLEDVQKHEVREASYIQNRSIIYKQIIPAIGHIQLKKLTAQYMQRFYANKMREGLKSNSIGAIQNIMHKALKNAVRWKLVSQNVCDQVTVPRGIETQSAAHPLTAEQTLHLLKFAQGHALEVLIVLALVTGMRRGEIMALRWGDIDFKKRSLRITKTVSYFWGRGYIEGLPKTESSKREIMLPQYTVDILLRHRRQQKEMRLKAGSIWAERDLVFCNGRGGYVNPSHLLKQFHKLLNQAELPRIRIHDLRHSAASLLILVLNMPPKLVQELLGHSDIEMTLNIYTHADESQQRKMMDTFDTFLGNNEEGKNSDLEQNS